MADYYVREEDGTSHYLLEDASGALLEEGLTTVAPSFIASATVVHAPTVAYTGQQTTLTVAGTYQWLCPVGVTQIYVEAVGGGGGGGGNVGNGAAGGGGGAWAKRSAIPVTPGTTYTFIVGSGGAGDATGAGASDGGNSSFVGDTGVQVVAAGGGGAHGVNDQTSGQGGQASASTGDTASVFSGGDGGAGTGGPGQSGSGGGASGNRLAAGANGGLGNGGGSGVGGTGGTGANGGGSGGHGGGYNATGDVTQPGSSPGGGGGGMGGGLAAAVGAGAAGTVYITTGIVPPFIGSRTTIYTPTAHAVAVNPPFISSHTVVYTAAIAINAPFIASHTVVYTPTVPEILAPFISSRTRVFGVFSLFDPNRTYQASGNGGETTLIRLAPSGITETATLAASITDTDTALELTGDGSFPNSEPFVATIDSEVVYLVQVAAGNYRIRGRGASNTLAAAHTAGATVSWGDSYDMALVAASDIEHSFTANINGTGSSLYTGWLVCFDSSQAYFGGSRYPMHIAELAGVFDAGAGSGGTNRCDGSQPSAVSTPLGASDHCPSGLCNPALITSDIAAGDVALVRYVNPEASVLDLGPRSVGIQSWFGLKRVDTTDHDVTLTNPNGIVVDTTGTYDTFTGSVNGVWAEPLPLATGIAPDASDAAGTEIATPNPVPWQTVTLPGADRYFTDGIHYSEHGWPFGLLAVRQGNRRVPFWRSWDWHDFSYVYTGFGVDCTFAQIVVNRNGDTTPGSALPGSQDIDGPDAVWDDATYYYGASWFVAIYATPYLVIGPVIGGTPLDEGTATFLPSVIFPGGGGGPTITPPGPTIEGGSGGNIGPPNIGELFQAAAV